MIADEGKDESKDEESHNTDGARSWDDSANVEEAGWFRTALPQVLANSAKNWLFLTIGMVQAYPTVLLPAIQNVDGPLCLNDNQASWIGSISFIAEPTGSFLSGTVMEPLGRKWAMIIVNIPFIAAWLLVYFASSPSMFYTAFTIMGLSIGLMESPILAYVGEISQPKLRGILSSYAQMSWMAGFLITFLIGSFLDWKNTALISLSVPILGILTISLAMPLVRINNTTIRTVTAFKFITYVGILLRTTRKFVFAVGLVFPIDPLPPNKSIHTFMYKIPETPMWLLSRNRLEEAERSLQWLRGWVSAAAVQKELSEMKAYRETMITSYAEDDESVFGKVFMKRLYSSFAMLFERKTLRPMLLIWIYFLLQSWTGQIGLRPYVIQVCNELKMPINPHWITVIMGMMNVVGCLLCLLVIRKTGIRFIALTSLGLGGVSCILLGVYAFGEAGNQINIDLPGKHWAPPVLLIAMVLVTSFGTIPLPWNLISEVFPFRTRDLATGICAAICCLFDFSSTKTFLDLKSFVGLQGVFWLNGIVGLVGMCFMYFCLYETEGRTLEEIEEHYSGKDKSKITKRNNKWFHQRNVFTPSVITISESSCVKKTDKFGKITDTS